MHKCMDLFLQHYVLSYLDHMLNSESKDSEYHVPILLGGEGFFKKEILSSFNWIHLMGENLKRVGMERYGVNIDYSVDTFQNYFDSIAE